MILELGGRCGQLALVGVEGVAWFGVDGMLELDPLKASAVPANPAARISRSSHLKKLRDSLLFNPLIMMPPNSKIDSQKFNLRGFVLL